MVDIVKQNKLIVYMCIYKIKINLYLNKNILWELF